jgi:hypothetical protein
MADVRLVRLKSTDQGTPGVLMLDGRRLAYTLELPWKDNRRQMSCIPDGSYDVGWIQTPRHGWVYGLRNVPGRSNILIHSGNVAGDEARGFRTHVLGCILLGAYFGTIAGQLAVLVSRPTVRALSDAMQQKPFKLEVSWAYSTSSPEAESVLSQAPSAASQGRSMT